MAATGGDSSWVDLNSELLVSISTADGLSLRDYDRLRGVCTSWRSALPPPYPCLLSLANDGRSASVFSLPLRSLFRLTSLRNTYSVVGSSNGCFAVQHSWTKRIFLVNPGAAGEEVEVTNMVCPSIEKLVFAPNRPPPGPNDSGWTVVALCHDRKTAVCMDTRSRGKWATIRVVARHASEYVADLAMDAGGSKVYCLDSRGGVHVLRITHVGHELAVAVEPLLTLMLTPVCAAFPAAFAPPYGISSAEHSTKHLFFFHGSLYQVCQRNDGYSGACSDKISLLRHDPLRWPCWDVVNDLGGCSVFVSTGSSPVVVRPASAGGTIPGVRADCVYWISSICVTMVCDIATGSSEPLVGPHGLCIGCCWYYNDDNMMGVNGDGSISTAAYGGRMEEPRLEYRNPSAARDS